MTDNSMMPPNVKAMFEEREEPLPEGAVARVIVRNLVGDDGGQSFAALVSIDIDSPQEAAALLITLRGVADEFQHEVARRLAQLTMSGPQGAMEALDIVKMVTGGSDGKYLVHKEIHHDN